MSISLTDKKRSKILVLALQFKNKSSCHIREFAQFIGILIAACRAVRYGFLYTMTPERQKFLALEKSGGNYETKMTLNTILS